MFFLGGKHPWDEFFVFHRLFNEGFLLGLTFVCIFLERWLRSDLQPIHFSWFILAGNFDERNPNGDPVWKHRQLWMAAMTFEGSQFEALFFRFNSRRFGWPVNGALLCSCLQSWIGGKWVCECLPRRPFEQLPFNGGRVSLRTKEVIGIWKKQSLFFISLQSLHIPAKNQNDLPLLWKKWCHIFFSSMTSRWDVPR